MHRKYLKECKNPKIMKTNNLTLKQENFALAFIRLGDKSAAYREVYSCSNMKPATIHSKASLLSDNGKVRARLEELQSIAKNVAEIEFKHTLKDSLNLDFELINRYNKHLQILENPLSTTKQVNTAKRAMAFIKVQGFNAAMERVSKKLGFYEKNNEQKQSIYDFEGFTPDKKKRLDELLAKANSQQTEDTK